MSDFDLLKTRLESLSSFVQEGASRIKFIEENKLKTETKICAKQEDSKTLIKVVELFKSLGGEGESYILEKLDKFISFALSRVFNTSYSFVSKMSIDGKDIKVDFFVTQKESDKILTLDVVDAKGGGVAEVVGLFIQIFFVVLGKDKFARFLLLDTALVHLSTEYVSNMSKLLQEVAHKTSIQLILITHTGMYGESSDCLYKFKQEDGHTKVEKIK